MAETAQITSHFVIAPNHGEHPVHGVYGGVTPHGVISMALYSERFAIPKEIDLEQSDDGASPVIEVARRGKVGTVRTVNGVFYLDVDMAESVAKWLLSHVEILKAQFGD